MRKILTILMAVLLTNAAIAQVNIGFRAGYNAATVKSSDAEITEDGKALSGFNIGTVVNVKMKGNLSFQTGLTIGTKGVSVAHEGHADNYKFTAADIPMNLVLNTKSGLFVGTGLNLGYNLSGKLDAEDDPTENYSFTFGSGKNFTRADLGLNILAGYKTKSGMFISGNSLMGLTDIKPGAETWRNNLFSISLGYMFKSSK
ncbi:MAG: PorT family protein [Chitinophagaceae bacterium]|nr:PorT family protein [Chitinophagaceae bacterium]